MCLSVTQKHMSPCVFGAGFGWAPCVWPLSMCNATTTLFSSLPRLTTLVSTIQTEHTGQRLLSVLTSNSMQVLLFIFNFFPSSAYVWRRPVISVWLSLLYLKKLLAVYASFRCNRGGTWHAMHQTAKRFGGFAAEMFSWVGIEQSSLATGQELSGIYHCVCQQWRQYNCRNAEYLTLRAQCWNENALLLLLMTSPSVSRRF